MNQCQEAYIFCTGLHINKIKEYLTMLPIGSGLKFLKNIALIISESAKMVKEIFGSVLREIRLEKKLSQEKLAEFADLDRTYIYRLEQGLREPSLSTFFMLSKALKMPPDEFIRRIDSFKKTGEKPLIKKKLKNV